MSLIDEMKPLAAEALPQLKGARGRLASKKQWTTKAFARSLPSRYPVGHTHALASCWCIRGAIRAEAGREGPTGSTAGEEFAAAVACHTGLLPDMKGSHRMNVHRLAIWNDEQATFADVTSLLDKSIKLAEAIVDGSYEYAMLIDVIPKTEK